MKEDIFADQESSVVAEHWAVVYAPRRQRQRFAENCVELCADEAEARQRADPAARRHAARVLGPSRSSEGLRIYYLVAWLEDGS